VGHNPPRKNYNYYNNYSYKIPLNLSYYELYVNLLYVTDMFHLAYNISNEQFTGLLLDITQNFKFIQ